MNLTTNLYAVSEIDYESVSTTKRAMACETSICTEVILVDDETVESKEETFNILLERSPRLDHRITLDGTPATITITDDDGMQTSLFFVIIFFICRYHFWSKGNKS